jgi:outer membrane protein insertion porin family
MFRTAYLLLPLGLLVAQAPQRYPIEAIRITGNKLFDQAAIVTTTGLHPGDLLEEKRIETARDKLLASGAFTNISYRYDPAPSKQGYVLTFEVTELAQLFEYRIERLDVDEAKLRAYLREREPLFGAKIPGAENVLARFRAEIGDYLRSQGKPAEVGGRVAVDNADTFVLFSPPGPLPAVATVNFVGNKVIPLTQLQNAIHPAAVGSQFREPRFRELLDMTVRPLYESRGRLRVKFTKIESKPSEGVRGLAVTVGIEEGEIYTFGEVHVKGAPGGEEAVVKAASLPEGDVANLQLVDAAQARIQNFLHANGHMAAETTSQRELNDSNRFCDITFVINPGPKYTFGKLTFQGLDIHGEAEMKRIWTMKPGGTYNGEYPEMFLARIKEEQLFDGLQNTRAVIIPNHEARTVDVKLVFNEPKPKIMK